MSGMKLASPFAGIDLIAPPVANSAGDARLQLPIEVPPGRNGVQPNLAFTYGSSHGNGWLGEGWDLDIPAIEIDTRYGVPDYGSSQFITNSAYLLNGEQLVPANDGDLNSFRRRVEGRFDLIHRNVSAVDPNSYGCSAIVESFVVTDKNGTVYTYGGNGATLTDPGNDCHTFKWNLSSVRDTFGNVMRFSYFLDRNSVPVNGDPWAFLYPDHIDYTAHESVPGNADKAASYSVVFARSADVRPDVIINGRNGFQTRMERRLDHVDVKFGDTVIRRYQLKYLAADNGEHFHKSLLTSIALQGLDKDHDEAHYAGRQLDEHTFDYSRRRGTETKSARSAT